MDFPSFLFFASECFLYFSENYPYFSENYPYDRKNCPYSGFRFLPDVLLCFWLLVADVSFLLRCGCPFRSTLKNSGMKKKSEIFSIPWINRIFVVENCFFILILTSYDYGKLQRLGFGEHA